VALQNREKSDHPQRGLKLCTFLTEVVAVQLAVDLISEGYFDGHDVLFVDVKEQLASSYESAKLLIVGYNFYAQENGGEPIDIDAVERCSERKVDQHLNEWVMLSRSKALAARGKIFEARDEVLSLLSVDKSVAE
jgi:hypothetical protein